MASKKTAVTVPVKMVSALQLQASPPVYVIAVSGKWLLSHTTPTWRSKDPILGFQRIVNESRARSIARTVLDQDRAFPNAITLASDIKDFVHNGTEIGLPEDVSFLVVDGQHRLWAQRYSERDCQYACIIHLNKTEKDMAELFLEINDNQKRVPSSLRWDLVRLVQPDKDEAEVTAAELVYELATRPTSPFFYNIDLTGEKKDVSIKQGSLAPEIRTLVVRANKRLTKPTFEEYASLLIRFFSAVRSLNPQGWGDATSTYYKARVLRALVRVLVDIILATDKFEDLSANKLLQLLSGIDPDTLSEARIRLAQGSAGVTDLYKTIKEQVIP